MKKILRRNQVMITALALMIVIAGYLHFTGSQVDKEDLITNGTDPVEASSVSVDGFVEYDAGTGEVSAADLLDISDEDIAAGTGTTDIESLDTDYVQGDAAYTEELEQVAANDLEEASTGALDEAAAEGLDEAAAEDYTVSEIPGEAVYTSSTAVTSLSAARLQKEQTRAKNKETLLEIINNVNIGDVQKQEAIDCMIQATEIAEKESAAEILLEAKGYTDAVVSITDDKVDVLVYGTTLTDAQCAQIEDIVKRKTGMEASNIIITPVAPAQ